ncbi:hypothetical protein, partial [Micromonospora qiuiae]|uniref:hypothetical protein n=1 Tax=Micromonospora qiuiae TaxID=502268 RepID=UPI00194EDA2F
MGNVVVLQELLTAQGASVPSARIAAGLAARQVKKSADEAVHYLRAWLKRNFGAGVSAKVSRHQDLGWALGDAAAAMAGGSRQSVRPARRKAIPSAEVARESDRPETWFAGVGLTFVDGEKLVGTVFADVNNVTHKRVTPRVSNVVVLRALLEARGASVPSARIKAALAARHLKEGASAAVHRL